MMGKRLVTSVAMAAAAIALAAPAQADYDTDFKNTVNHFGVYGGQDQLAWLGKISCDRINRGLDTDPYKSADFIQHNLPRGTTQGQAFQFLGAAIDHYCPNQTGFLQAAGR
ncbi:MAG TPA: DUF732 domain-containing protein [Mycobacterium sp.]|jgi:hypothetical protein|nr:DUF732 domain-containing protein [Mycobacterium sp.]